MESGQYGVFGNERSGSIGGIRGFIFLVKAVANEWL